MILRVGTPYGKLPPCHVGGHKHCGSGDIRFEVAEEEYSRCSSFNSPLLFISKGHGLKTRGILY